ncbi:MAG: hypothetical protein ABIQ40_08335 [Bacteroidia bacterium]
MDRDEIISRIFSFLDKIGIQYEESKIEDSSFMPGMIIRNGKLIVDIETLKYPGDLLHEAGHIAVSHPEKRNKMNGEIAKENAGEEIAALLWSYMAARETGIPAEVVFHPDGYKGDSEWLLENFKNKMFIGYPLLNWMKIFEKKDGDLKVISWLRN